MPLVLGSITPPPGPPGGGYPQLPADPIDCTWLAPDGTVWPLTTPDLGWHTLDAVAGAFGVTPISLTADSNPRFGAQVRHIQAQPRIITWPLRVEGRDQTEFIGRWRALARAFTQTRRLGPGILRIARPDGSARQIAAYYQAGFDGVSGAGWYWDNAIITLYCEDPYWSAVEPVVVTRSYSASSDDFLAPFPLISSSQTLGDTTINNPGDVEAWPSWAITGPAASVAATSNTRGEVFTLDPDWDGGGDLAGGDIIAITTEPPTVVGPDGSSWVGALDWPDAQLWPLDPGDNDITFSVSGSASGTEIALTFYPRYETP